MEEQVKQQDEQQRRIVGRPFPRGRSGNVAGRPSAAGKRARIAAKVVELSAELGGLDQLTPIERVLIESAATLALQNPQDPEQSVRCANACARLIASVERRRARARHAAEAFAPALPSVAELLAGLK